MRVEEMFKIQYALQKVCEVTVTTELLGDWIEF